MKPAPDIILAALLPLGPAEEVSVRAFNTIFRYPAPVMKILPQHGFKGLIYGGYPFVPALRLAQQDGMGPHADIPVPYLQRLSETHAGAVQQPEQGRHQMQAVMRVPVLETQSVGRLEQRVHFGVREHMGYIGPLRLSPGHGDVAFVAHHGGEGQEAPHHGTVITYRHRTHLRHSFVNPFRIDILADVFLFIIPAYKEPVNLPEKVRISERVLLY